jgi:hypothetical protein
MSSDEERGAAMFSDALNNALSNRCLVSTIAGHVGRVPQTIEVDDVGAILYGCSTPVILDPLKYKHDEYEFVGDCYVQGIMKGEAVEAHHEQNGEDMTFFLR